MRHSILSSMMVLMLFSTAACGGAGADGEPDDADPADMSEAATGDQCQPIPACDAAPPDPGRRARWKHFGSSLIASSGRANHRGRDLLVNPGEPQWVIAKMSYGLFDKDLKDEEVDIFLLRDCGATWEKLGTATTTQDDDHATVEGVADSGGRVYFEIPPEKALGLGRHRIRLVVRGDLSATELFIEVVPPGTPIVVSDVDGTLTTQEAEEFSALLTGKLPDANAGAPQVLQALAAKGYRPMYLTARPEFLVQRTRDFLSQRGFPPGVVHTTLALTGAVGASASQFKTAELAQLGDRGLTPAWAFGNTSTDAEAYEAAGIEPREQRIFYRFTDSDHGGRRVESYTDLLRQIDALPSLCR